jgi:hypothetical protein
MLQSRLLFGRVNEKIKFLRKLYIQFKSYVNKNKFQEMIDGEKYEEKPPLSIKEKLVICFYELLGTMMLVLGYNFTN